jgi:hypothetical protein
MAVGDNSECFMRRTTYSIIHYVSSVCVCVVCWEHTVWMAAALRIYVQCRSGQAINVGTATEKSNIVQFMTNVTI